jgi:hypothetical protein
MRVWVEVWEMVGPGAPISMYQGLGLEVGDLWPATWVSRHFPPVADLQPALTGTVTLCVGRKMVLLGVVEELVPSHSVTWQAPRA